MTQPPPAWQLFNEIAIIDQLASAAFAEVLPRGITRAQFVVLNHLWHRARPSQSPAQIAAAIQVTRSTISSTLGRLAARGLIAIAPDPSDGRGKQVQLTESGRAMRETCIAAVAPMLPIAASAFDSTELDQALALLKRLRERLDAARD
jgi:DNA-binding MarR family transcriptional regulator